MRASVIFPLIKTTEGSPLTVVYTIVFSLLGALSPFDIVYTILPFTHIER